EFGPGPNSFCDSAACTWVDGSGRLHMTIQDDAGFWQSTELALEDALGYGDYIFTTVGRLDTLDEHTVLGLFLWQYNACWDPAYLWWNSQNEADIEYSRWGDPANPDVGNFTVQPVVPGNQSTYPVTFSDGEITSHAFRWLPDRMEYRAWRGGPDDEAVSPVIHAWTYTGGYLPRPDRPRIHINLWYIFNPPAGDQEVVFDDFRFVPEDSPAVSVPVGPETAAAGRVLTVGPNPFRNATDVRFRIRQPGRVELSVHDVAGRRVRTLLDRTLPAGDHVATWNAGTRPDVASPAPGVYFVRLRVGSAVETRRVVRLR
ncbi:MAG: T9SS type A sorting domain-containing protein, partial [Gemmatimonadetes bacterium]|nr:T9SS type A sorting domain-containing protein [Gemmatimonadota bacterium]